MRDEVHYAKGEGFKSTYSRGGFKEPDLRENQLSEKDHTPSFGKEVK
jgi:hypothetical protein